MMLKLVCNVVRLELGHVCAGYIVLGIYILLLVGSGFLAAIFNWILRKQGKGGGLVSVRDGTAP